MTKKEKNKELFKSPHTVEVQDIVKARTQHDLTVNNFATISAIKGDQFGREVFISLVPFKDLMDFLQVFPNVQRSIIKRRVGTIKNYVLSGIENTDLMRFFSAITVTCKGHMFYSDDTKKVAIDTAHSKLSVNDGQHRFYGISEAIRELRGRVNNGRTEEIKQTSRENLYKLERMVIPLVMFNQISEREEKQLFFDLNNLAQRPSRSATIRLAQTDLTSRLAREIATENKYMIHYGVEMDKTSIHENNPNTILLTTIYKCIRLLYWNEFKKNSQFLNEDNYLDVKKSVHETFNNLFFSLPHDVNVKGKYLVEKSYTLKGIIKFIYKCRNDLTILEEDIFNTISKVNWKTDMEYWSVYGANLSRTGSLVFTSAEGGVLAVYECLMDNLVTNIGLTKDEIIKESI